MATITFPTAGNLVERVDAVARDLRVSSRPRRDLAEALDWYVGEWAASGYVAPCLAALDHLRTLAAAAAEAERHHGGTRPGPVDDPWPVAP
jgi:hypothetical protein